MGLWCGSSDRMTGGVLEELEPIDENRKYDFNYQQITHLLREVKILPVSDESDSCTISL